ncbi:MAG: hypothetical protein ACWIPI_06155, partial [Polaribacter sp.]
FNTARSNLFNCLNTYELSPTIEKLNKLVAHSNRVIEVRKEVEGNIWYELTEIELQEKTQKNKLQAKELQELKGQIQALQEQLETDKDTVIMAKYIVSNQKAPVSKKSINKPSKKLCLNTNLSQTEIESLHNDLKPYFVSALEQWQNLFSKDITPFASPIKANRGVTIIMIATIFKELEKRGIAEQWKSIIEKSKAFEKSNKIIEASSLTDALRKQRKGYQPNRKSIINLNYIKDIIGKYID